MVYLDHAATTPLHPRVFEAMRPFFCERFANASGSYAAARSARHAIDVAREQVAALIGANAQEIYFTSGGSEADNWALRGILSASSEKKEHIVTSSIEHHAILRTCERLEKQGTRVTYLPVDENAVVDPAVLPHVLCPETVLVSVMLANNEVGSIQPIHAIAEIAHQHGIPVHSDAVQAAGHIPINVNQLGIDLLSLSGHKFGGPQGIGALYIRKGTRIDPFIIGGEQEMGMRAGTENLAAIVGLGEAASLARESLSASSERIAALRDSMITKLKSAIPSLIVNAANVDRLPGHLHLTIPDADTSLLLMLLDMRGIAASAGSACASGSTARSHVLTAMGYDTNAHQADLRFTLGETTTAADIDKAVAALISILLN